MRFACNDYDLQELVMCSFDITKREYLILETIFSKPFATAESIANELRLDRSTVQKSLSQLFLKKLIQRRQRNLNHGGYKYHYHVPNKAELKRDMLNIISKWHEGVVAVVQEW